MSDQPEGNLPADASDPGYAQLGDEGNPLTGDASKQGTETEQPSVEPSSDDEEDRAAHHA